LTNYVFHNKLSLIIGLKYKISVNYQNNIPKFFQILLTKYLLFVILIIRKVKGF